MAAGVVDRPWEIYRYSRNHTREALDLMAQENDGDPYDAVILGFRNPVKGGHTTRNLACHIQMSRPGEKTKSHRHTETWIYHVYAGMGLTVVGEDGGTKLEWLDKDAFVVPSWEPHYHHNLGEKSTYLFSVVDRPIIEAAGLYREQSSKRD